MRPTINFVGTTRKQPLICRYGEVPMQCFNPVMLKVINTFVPAVVNSTGGLAVTRSTSPTGDKNLLVRGDYQLNGQHSFDARYDLINSNAFGPLGVNSSSVGRRILRHPVARKHSATSAMSGGPG